MNKRIVQSKDNIATISSSRPPPQKYRVMQTGSRGHDKTMRAMREYHLAKKDGKTCLIMAKNEQEKIRLIQNHFVDPNDIQVANPNARRGQTWN